MIRISADDAVRSRIWHWFVDDCLVKRARFSERRKSGSRR